MDVKHAKVILRAPQERDAEHVALHLRSHTRALIETTEGIDLLQAVRQSVEASAQVQTAIGPDGEVLAMLGCAPTPDPCACAPWLLATERATEHQGALLREVRPLIAGWLDRWPLLINHVAPRDRCGIRCIQQLGFTVLPEAPLGPGGPAMRVFFLRAQSGSALQ